jgi:RNA polymerase sigma-70 factor (ECF subfamily)
MAGAGIAGGKRQLQLSGKNTAMQIALVASEEPVRRVRQDDSASHDAILMARIAKGDRTAMHALFSNRHVQVFRFVQRQLRNAALAEDVTSEVFLDVWRCADRFEGRSSVLTWILAIARHKAYSARPRHSLEPVDEDVAEAVADDCNPAASVQAQDRSRLLSKCLTTLSPENREIIDLVYYQEQSIDAVARILCIPHNTAKTRLFRARKRLADELKKAGIDYASI